MSQYLIAAAVGPVQEFIASARKLRDLWYGSYLLSELSKAVARSLAESGCELIFPAVAEIGELKVNSEMNVANKILVLSPVGGDPARLIQQAQAAFAGYWRDICEKALQQARRNIGINEDLFFKQVDDFGEFFAVWVLYDSENYAGCRDKVEARLSGRKNLRSFSAPNWDGVGKPKSSLDGVRESVIEDSKKQTSFMLKKGEQLDALGIVKRFGPWDHSGRPQFDNLAQVAIQPYLTGLREAAVENSKIAEKIADLPTGEELYADCQDLPIINLEIWEGWPQNLPPELLHPAVFAEEKLAAGDKNAPPVWGEMEEILRYLWKKSPEPQAYAALLLGDGDRMGEALNLITKLADHQQFSHELDVFSRQVHKTVAGFAGKVIYSGGDDVMAYLPLHRVLACAQAVNQLFADCMEKACRGTAVKKLPTFSIGLALIHQRSPLHDALNRARKAEHCAKQVGGRDALAIIQDKRSGSELKIYGKWQEQGALSGLPQRLHEFIQAYVDNQLSSRLGYQLRALEKEYGTALQKEAETGELKFKNGLPDNVLAAETLRVIEHKRNLDPLKLIGGQARLRALSDELVVSRQLFKSIELSRGLWDDRRKGEESL